jgi:hypothetical protein
MGLDHGVGHPLLLLCHAKAPNYLKKKGFKDLPDYSKWPKVADAVIEACNLFALSFTLTSNCSGSLIEIKRFVRFRPGKTTPLLKLDGSKYSNRSRLAQNLAPPMTSQEVNAALHQSLGLPEVSESKPTIPRLPECTPTADFALPDAPARSRFCVSGYVRLLTSGLHFYCSRGSRV